MCVGCLQWFWLWYVNGSFCRFDCLVCLVVLACVPVVMFCLSGFGGVYRTVAFLVFCTFVVCGFVLMMVACALRLFSMCVLICCVLLVLVVFPCFDSVIVGFIFGLGGRLVFVLGFWWGSGFCLVVEAGFWSRL